MCLLICLAGSAHAGAMDDATRDALAALAQEEKAAIAKREAIEAVIHEREAEHLKLQVLAETLQNQLAALGGDSSLHAVKSPEQQKLEADLLALANDRIGVLRKESESVGITFVAIHQGQRRIFTSAEQFAAAPEAVPMGLRGGRISSGSEIHCPAGLSLVCFEPDAPDLPAFEIASPDDSSKPGDAVMILSVNMLESQVIGISGRIRGVGPDVWELDAPLDRSMVGAPVVALDTGKVIGVLSHEVDGAKMDWARGTRHEEPRRLATRLDRITEWRTMEISRFTNEAAYIERFLRENRMAWHAFMLLEYGKGGSPNFAPRYPFPENRSQEIANNTKRSRDLVSHRNLMRELRAEAQDHKEHPQIKRALRWLDGGMNDRPFIYRQMIDEMKVTQDLRNQFSWYHAKIYQEALDERADGIRILTESAARVGRN